MRKINLVKENMDNNQIAATAEPQACLGCIGCLIGGIFLVVSASHAA